MKDWQSLVNERISHILQERVDLRLEGRNLEKDEIKAIRIEELEDITSEMINNLFDGINVEPDGYVYTDTHFEAPEFPEEPSSKPKRVSDPTQRDWDKPELGN